MAVKRVCSVIKTCL